MINQKTGTKICVTHPLVGIIGGSLKIWIRFGADFGAAVHLFRMPAPNPLLEVSTLNFPNLTDFPNGRNVIPDI